MKLLFIGKSKSGKSTMSDYLKHKYGFKVYSLGDYVKYFTHDIAKIFVQTDNVGLPDIKDFFDVNTKDKYRKYFQLFGTDLCQKWFGKEVWCECLYKDLIKRNELNNYTSIIIDDCRFQHEYDYFVKLGFIPIKIERCVENSNKSISNHVSETESEEIPYDILIENNGDINDLYDKIEKMIDKLLYECEIELIPLVLKSKM